jgi:hypothetical protein
LRLLLVLFLFAASCQAAAQNTNEPPKPMRDKSDWEIEQEKSKLGESATLPALPKNENLIEFWVTNSSTFRFFIDSASLSVSDDYVVRYTLVARSPSGVANISYEAMHCAEGRYRVYAYAIDGKWVPRPSEWKAIEPNTMQRWHNELRFRYFCVLKRGGLLTREEGLDALRRGGHPGAMTRPGF